MLKKLLVAVPLLSAHVDSAVQEPNQERNRVSAWIESDQGEKCVIQDLEDDTIIVCPRSETLYLQANPGQTNKGRK